MTMLLKKRVQFALFIVGIVFLSFAAEKCRELVGEESASKSGKFTIFNCFDGSLGTLACLAKESVKLYSYNIRSIHVEDRRNRAIENALADAISQGITAKDAAKIAQKEGEKAAKLATRKVKRIVGPIISSGWDFFEAIYFGGTMTEGFLRGLGTLFGTYTVGFVGEERFGRFGYLIGSHLGSWIGGRIGLMVYDVVNGIQYIILPLQATTQETASYDEIVEPDNFEKSEVVSDSSSLESTSSSSADESSNYETQDDTKFGSTWSSIFPVPEDNNYETPADNSFIYQEEL